MLEILGLLFSWMPPNLQMIATAVVVIFVLLFFVLLILKVIDLIKW